MRFLLPCLAALLGTFPAWGQPRDISGHIYGVTVDDVANASDIATALQRMPRFPTVRVVFDRSESWSTYAEPLKKFRPYAYILGMLADSSEMEALSLSAYGSRTQSYYDNLKDTVDLWEIGNEVNGNWLGVGVQDKIQAAFDVISAGGGKTMLTFHYAGEAGGANCNDSPQNDMFAWISLMFGMDRPAEKRDPNRERLRNGLALVAVSWYPDQCPQVTPDWASVFIRLSALFPNSGVGFGEVGTARAQNGSQHEIDLATEFYSLHTRTALPPAYRAGVFWWYWRQDAVPYTKPFWAIIARLIRDNP